MRLYLAMLAALAMLIAAPGCKKEDDSALPPYDASRARRVFRPPPGEVRAVPPHAIHATGMGPYVLGTPLKTILDLLPHGPRVVLMQIDDLVDYSLVRTEGDALLIGVGQATGVAFVAVLDREIARTESGLGVGTPVSKLREDMGPAVTSPTLVMDGRLIGFEKLPNARFVLEHGGESARVAAVVVRRAKTPLPELPAAGDAEPEDAPRPPPCRAREMWTAREEAVVQAARLPADAAPRLAHGCFSGEPEVLISDGDRLVVMGGEADRPRRVGSELIPGVVFVAPLDADLDGRDEIAVVSTLSRDNERVWRVEVLRLEAGRFSRMASQEVYRVSSTSAAWVGAKVDDIDLLIELHAGAEDLRVTGLYVQHGEDGMSTVAPLSSVDVTLRRKRPAVTALEEPGEPDEPDEPDEPGEPGEPDAPDEVKPPEPWDAAVEPAERPGAEPEPAPEP